MQIIITAGNHDSSSRLEVTRTLWNHLGVHVIGKIERTDSDIDYLKHIIPICVSGKTIGYVVALPHFFLNSLPLVKKEGNSTKYSAFFHNLSDKVTAINTNHLPIVMMAHMAISGCDITGHDQLVGGMEYLPINELKVDYDYLALGHIHCPQFIETGEDATSCARYCGSPIPVSFDESYPHSVTVVELEKHGEKPQIRTIPIHNPWPLKTIPSIAVPFDEAMKVLNDFPQDKQAYIRLHVQLTDVPPYNAMERACVVCQDKKARFCCFKWERNATSIHENRSFVDVDEIKAKSPLEIAELYYSNKYGQALDSDLKEMLNLVVKKINQSTK